MRIDASESTNSRVAVQWVNQALCRYNILRDEDSLGVNESLGFQITFGDESHAFG